MNKFGYLSYLHSLAIKKEKARILRTYISTNQVMSGPFSGLKYPSYVTNGSALLPKLVGSYEAELHQEISELLRNNYSEIIDVGCAEGYYAIGLALIIPDVKVYAFDINPQAQILCEKMAIENNVDSRVYLHGSCKETDLKKIPVRKKALIVSDCEGFELKLFTQAIIADLSECDFLIETHDCYDSRISKTLKDRFQFTHDLTSIYSISDLAKTESYLFHKKAGIPRKYLFNLYSEERIGVSEWIICRSKN
ncbi:methyltransferase family protein [Algoriphagus yeomjeoni]|uniref:Methyltransferase family protein n=2 Tax=Algoriphagus yeomjeoni TaxID=291403 RepID=A0A327P2D2_9BACT|nr:methyltransferase family protein [Algoriphagus yeomjeoni]